MAHAASCCAVVSILHTTAMVAGAEGKEKPLIHATPWCCAVLTSGLRHALFSGCASGSASSFALVCRLAYCAAMLLWLFTCGLFAARRSCAAVYRCGLLFWRL